MKGTIKGIAEVNYYSTKNERQVEGTTFHIEYKDANVVGSAVDPLYFGKSTLDNLGVEILPEKFRELIGRTLEVEYNRRGFPQSIVIS